MQPQAQKDPGYPKIIDISSRKQPFKHDRRDPNFDRPLADLKQTFPKPVTGILFFKIRPQN